MPKKKDSEEPAKKYLNNDAKLLKLDLFSKFYDNKQNLKKVMNIINHRTDHSLRVLEWFCSNYAKKNNILIKVSPSKEINVFLEYKACLDSYSKIKFDPFKRKHLGYSKFDINVDFSDVPEKSFETTVGQLNFFRWCIRNKILDYVQSHMQKIKDDMNTVIKANYSKTPKKVSNGSDKGISAPKERKKRVTLSPALTKTCMKSASKTVKF